MKFGENIFSAQFREINAIYWLNTRGSALLLVTLLSGFMIASFMLFSGVVRDSIRSHSTSAIDDAIAVDEFRESYRATGTGYLPKGYALETTSNVDYKTATVLSGSLLSVPWNESGILYVTRIDGAGFCYGAMDGSTPREGCISSSSSDSGSIVLTSSSGTLTFSTLGGYSQISISPNTSVSIPGTTLRVLRSRGGISFLEYILSL